MIIGSKGIKTIFFVTIFLMGISSEGIDLGAITEGMLRTNYLLSFRYNVFINRQFILIL